MFNKGREHPVGQGKGRKRGISGGDPAAWFAKILSLYGQREAYTQGPTSKSYFC
jgi:hypothetical protein